MLTTVFVWWKEQMRDLVPASARLSGRTWRRELIVVAGNAGASTVELFLQGRGSGIALGWYSLAGEDLRAPLAHLSGSRRMAVALRVSRDLMLEREIVLPLAAERDLRRIITYEMDRLTPFRADEVFWTCNTDRRDSARNRMQVRVTIVPRVRVQPVLAALQRVRLVPVRIETAGSAGPQHIIPLDGKPRGGNRLGPRTDAYALGGCGMLAVAAVALPFAVQSIVRASIDARIEAMRPQVALREKLRTQISNRASLANIISAARVQAGAPLHSIAMLTAVLPDDTHLTTLSLRQHKLTISGRSAAAARLISAMAAQPLIHNPAFAAPVIRDEDNGGEMFSIRADLGS